MGGPVNSDYGKGKVGVYSENGVTYKAVANNYDKSKMLVFMYDEQTGQEINRREVKMIDNEINGEKISDNKVPYMEYNENDMSYTYNSEGKREYIKPGFLKGCAIAAQEAYSGEDYETLSSLSQEEQGTKSSIFGCYTYKKV